MGLKILHIAPFNTAGVPLLLSRAEQQAGHESRLAVLGGRTQARESDIELNLPFLTSPFTRLAKRAFTPRSRRRLSHVAVPPAQIPIEWRPANSGEKYLVTLREALWKPNIDRFARDIDLFSFDVIQLDGGLGFYRDGRMIRRLHEAGKKIICCYTGSDLRTRGVIPEIDALSDCNVTVEFDHLRFHPRISHVPFPFQLPEYLHRPVPDDGLIRIGHAPTNKQVKGSDTIIRIVRNLENQYPVKLILIENLDWLNALTAKAGCALFIDQIGNLGFGMNSLEALAMGIPALTSLAPGYETKYPDHPFVEISGDDLAQKLVPLIRDSRVRERIGAKGKEWVSVRHDPLRVIRKIHELAGLAQ